VTVSGTARAAALSSACWADERRDGMPGRPGSRVRRGNPAGSAGGDSAGGDSAGGGGASAAGNGGLAAGTPLRADAARRFCSGSVAGSRWSALAAGTCRAAPPAWSRAARAASTAARIRCSNASGRTGRLVGAGALRAAPGTRRVSGGVGLSSAMRLTPRVPRCTARLYLASIPGRPDEHMMHRYSSSMTPCHDADTGRDRTERCALTKIRPAAARDLALGGG
jgi:hypothetical protein